MQEEILWHQKSRSDWINSRDRNTKFYHIKAINERMRNKISTLKDDAGTWLEDEKEVKDHVVGFYKDLFCDRDMSLDNNLTALSFPSIEDGCRVHQL